VKKINKVVVRRDGKIVHALGFSSSGSWWTKCGCQLRKGDENYSEHDYDVRFVINCKRCRKALGMSLLDSPKVVDPGVSPVIERDETVMDGKDVYYEVRMKDGSHELVYDVMSAQEAADQVLASFDISPSEIECIHKIGVLKVIHPTQTISFVE